MWTDNRISDELKSVWILIFLTFLLLSNPAWAFDPYTGTLTTNDLRKQIPMGVGWGNRAREDLISEKCFVIIGQIVVPTRGSLRTHPWLAEQTITVFEREYGIPLNNETKAEILLGTIEEDIDLTGGATGVPAYIDVELDECIEGSIAHVLTHFENPYSRSENHFYDRTGGLPSSIVGVSEHAIPSVEWATTSPINTHTWSRAVQAARHGQTDTEKLAGWRSLGHILHLLQDAGVPAHTRDDVHALRKEPYEQFLGDVSYTNHGEQYGKIDVSKLKPTSFQFRSIKQFIHKLAEYTQANYFSEDTIFLDKIQFSEETRDLLRNTRIDTYQWKEGLFTYYIVANFPDPDPDHAFPAFLPDFSGTDRRRIATYHWTFFIANPLAPLGPLDPDQYFPTTPEEAESIENYLTVKDIAIVRDYWQDMAPRIIAISAEVIKLFYDAVTAPNSPPTITSFTATPLSVSVGGQSIISIEASDPDNDPLTYAWSATCGALSSTTGPEDKTWTAPASSGTCTISVTVTDPFGTSATASVDVAVTAPPPPTPAFIGVAQSQIIAIRNTVNPSQPPEGTVPDASRFIGTAQSRVMALLNAVDPSTPLAGGILDATRFVGTTQSQVVAVLNTVNPSEPPAGQAPGSSQFVGDAQSQVITVLNAVDPSQPAEGETPDASQFIDTAQSQVVTIVNEVDPSVPPEGEIPDETQFIGEAQSPLFSVQNLAEL